MKRKRSKWLAIGLILGLVVVGAMYGLYRYHFPYGLTHCCSKMLVLALHQYALANDGHFPAGAGCPEASLSLIYGDKYGGCAEILCGKTIPVEKAKVVLERGELLGPDTCDWHYVEGLTLADDRRLALVWDKVGLDHNGGRLPKGGHTVLFPDCSEEIIPESEWPQFLEEQKKLMATRTEAAKKGLPMQEKQKKE